MSAAWWTCEGRREDDETVPREDVLARYAEAAAEAYALQAAKDGHMADGETLRVRVLACDRMPVDYRYDVLVEERWHATLKQPPPASPKEGR